MNIFKLIKDYTGHTMVLNTNFTQVWCPIFYNFLNKLNYEVLL